MRVLEGLEPKKVFEYFEDLTQIPRGSGNEAGAAEYCMEFAKKRGLSASRDEFNNVVIVKEASAGYEDAPTVIIQGHLDMVCEKEADCTIDFAKDPLDVAIDGDFVYAKGTTLGGDDGIAVAIALAILDDDSLSHPRLECLFTTGEEVGLLGAKDFDASHMKGRRLINIDSEEEGIFTVSCAGGMDGILHIPAVYQETEGVRYTVTVDGLQGGHSGAEIHKEHGNSNILMGRALCWLDEVVNFRIAGLSGGLMDNAIPRSTKAVLYVPEEECQAFEDRLNTLDAIYKTEFAASDAGVTVSFVSEGKANGQALTPKCAAILMYVLHMVPNGVIKDSMDIPGLVQTSLNLGILRLTNEEATATFSIRSSIESEKQELGDRLRHCVEFLGGTYEEKGSYPGWEYRHESELRDTCVSVFKKMYDRNPKVMAIHAGLECGLFSGKMEGLDCVSIGPNLYDIHTPKERLSISSTKRIYEFVVEVLKELR